MDIEQMVEQYEQGVSCSKLAKIYNVSRWTITDRLRKHGVIIINKHNAPKLNSEFFNSIDTEEKAYWLGFMFADGYVNGKSNAIELSLQLSDLQHLEKFKNDIGYTNNIYVDNHRCRFCISDSKLNSDLQKHGCVPNKSLILKFPTTIPDDLIRHFVRGYFDGDGYLKIVSLKSGIVRGYFEVLGTLEFLTKLANVLEVPCKLRKDKRHSGNTFTLSCNVIDSTKVLTYMYANCNIALDRKYEKYLKLPS